METDQINLSGDGRHTMLKVADVVIESPEFATLFFDAAINFLPGQFIMLWIPGIDEKPYTVSYHSDRQFAVTVEAKGIFSQKAITLKKGDLVGFRGPFGNGFSFSRQEVCTVVAGGCGMAPLAALVEQLGPDTLLIQGARTKDYILYPERFTVSRKLCTDDGSLGHKGFVTDLLQQTFDSEHRPDRVYACGPEIMMHKVFSLCEAAGIPCQVSLERYMRCGFGICGACACGDRLVCSDGPVFHSEQLREMTDFNRSALLKSGREVDLSQYFSWRCQ